MEVLYSRCAGLDVHKKTVTVCRMETKMNGQVLKEFRTFETHLTDLLRMRDWLSQWDASHVALESTGEYWRPVWNILEGSFELVLVNPRQVKQVPGRKTDVKDAEWLAELLRHGLVKASFVPDRPQRELRDLTRQRSKLVGEKADVLNRLQKVLEDANIKLASVVSDVNGVSSRAILTEMVQGQDDPGLLAELARGQLRTKRAELERALTGRVRDHHRFLLANHLVHIDFLNEQIEQFNRRIAEQLDLMSPPNQGTAADTELETRGGPEHPLSPVQAVALLDTIPGVSEQLAQVLIAEVGTDMARFPNAGHLASWAGVAPGNNVSAGKQHSAKTPPGNRMLRKTLAQAAHGATRKNDCYLQATYRRLVGRRGKKRAIIALAHSIIEATYYMLLRHEPYHDLGADYLDQRKKDLILKRLVKRMERLGYQVSLQLQPGAAA